MKQRLVKDLDFVWRFECKIEIIDKDEWNVNGYHKIRIPIFGRVLIFRRNRGYVVVRRVLQRLPWCWMRRILRSRNQQALTWVLRIWLWLPQLISTEHKQRITLASFSLSTTLTILPNEGMTLMLMLLK